ncbi:hypothetical protein P7K49_031541, partial [Saguinus oedipus]
EEIPILAGHMAAIMQPAELQTGPMWGPHKAQARLFSQGLLEQRAGRVGHSAAT